MDESPVFRERLAELEQCGSCEVSNAIETLGLRLRNEGYTDQTVLCQTPDLPPAVGFAVTLRIRSSAPPPDRPLYTDRTDWWPRLLEIPAPRILVVEEIDRRPESGAFLGEVHGHVFAALGCRGIVTNGAVRDIRKLSEMGFAAFSGGVSVSHAYMHVVEVGKPVKVGGLAVQPGDLLHGDRHGIVQIPRDAATLVPGIVAKQREREAAIIAYCRAPGFTVEGLRRLLA